MDWSRWASLAVVGLHVVFLGAHLLGGDDSEPLTSEDLFEGIMGFGLWFAICIGCIWWGDELGEGLVGAKFGLISSASPGWAVKLMGWVLLWLPAVVVVVGAIR
jgi:hypothetical protein